LLEDPASHLVDGQVLPQPAPPLSSPSRSSPHSQGSETGERYSRKVFVGGLPPDIDEGMLAEAARCGGFYTAAPKYWLFMKSVIIYRCSLSYHFKVSLLLNVYCFLFS
jgi:hypothetical protein